MVERLFLDWIDAETARAPIRRQYDLAAHIGANKTKPPLPFMQLAKPRAQCTFHPTVTHCSPIARGETLVHFGVEVHDRHYIR